jgi:hypothetical protein
VADALGVVEAVDPEEHPPAVELLLQGLVLVLGLRRGGERRELLGVDRDRVRDGTHLPPVGQDQQVAERGHAGEQVLDRPHEVVAVLRGVEADAVGGQQTVEQPVAPRQPDEQLGRREGHVQEESDRRVGDEAAQHLRAAASGGSPAPR